MKKLIRKMQLKLKSLSPLPIGEGLGERLLLFGALFLCSCSQSDALIPDVEANALQLFSVSLPESAATRSAVSSVQTVSVYTTYASNNAPYTAKSLATYSLSGGTWSAPSATAPVIEDNVKVYAYYPVGGSVTNNTSGNHTVAVQVKQTDTFTGTQPDYLYAAPATASTSNHSVSLTLNHALCKVSFKIRKSTTATETLTLEKIEIMSPTNRLQVGDASMNLSTGVLNGLVTTSSIALTGSIALQTAQAQPNVSCLLAAMTGQESVLSFRLTVKVSAETTSRTFLTKAMTPVQWKAGNHYVYSINVDKMSASLTGISVDKWKTDANQTTSIGI